MSREPEARFQSELWRILREICSRGPVGGLSLRVTVEEPAFDGRSPDIVVAREHDGLPILIIETKRKSRGRYPYPYKFTPYDPSVIGQALSYAALAKEAFKLPATPLFATSNPDVLVLFGPVDDPWRYLNREAVIKADYERALEPGAFMKLISKHYIFDDRNPLKEEVAFRVLDTAVKIWLKEVEILKIRKEIGFWLIDQLRYFVDYMDSYYVREPLRSRLSRDQNYYGELDGYARKMGYTDGLTDIVGSDLSKVENLSRMMVYVLLNKIIFYKVLENYYNLPKLEPFALSVNSSSEYLDRLNKFFEEAVKVSGDFEQIFYTGLYDKIIIADDVYALFQIDELIKILSEVNIQEFSDIIGHVYENLIPEEERHRLGQFYTPRPIAELITRWCIRSGDDVVLGPGCGSGTFEVEAYWRLVEFKTGRRAIPSKDVHTKVLKQIYALDINSFPAQLTAMNLAMKNVRAPVTNLNIIESDFFSIMPGQEVLLPYKVQTPEGPKEKKIQLPTEGFDAVFGNPPYTRWIEIPEDVKRNVKDRLDQQLSKYNLHADVARGKEPGIYIHFIMWAKEFLKPGGRLGMIISDSWLQTDYGVDFGRYLLENYRVKALIDISTRVFPVPLIGTCILLLEKPAEGEDVGNNDVVFMYLNVPQGSSLRISDILGALSNPEEARTRYIIKTYKQRNIPKDVKWINLIFNTEEILSIIRETTIPAKYCFECSYGNANYLYLASTGRVGGPRNIGAKDFFYFNEEKVHRWSLHEFVYPAITSARYVVNFKFTEEDWQELRDRGSDCYFFMCHKPREELPQNVLRYIHWGETECRTQIRETRGGGRPCNQAQACQERERRREYFFGWYDLGGVMNAPILAVYQSRYKTRFIWNKINAVTYHAMIAFIPKDEVKLTETRIKALLAYLNSSFIQLYIESMGRTTGAVGPIGLEVRHAEEMPIIDVRSLDERTIDELASLFDKLDEESRRLGGADKRENVEKLWGGVISEIDEKVCEILNISPMLASAAKALSHMMMERRLARAGEARREALKGTEEETVLQRPKKRKTRGGVEQAKSLNHFI